jgi:hypothetical protein
MISFYLGVAARCPFLNRSTSWVPVANPSGTFLYVRPACGHMPNIKLSGFIPSHVSFLASPFHCLPPLLPYVIAWLLPLPGMSCVRLQPAHWLPPFLSCKPCNLPCLSFALAWLVVQDLDTSSCMPRVRAWMHGSVQLFFSALYVLLLCVAPPSMAFALHAYNKNRSPIFTSNTKSLPTSTRGITAF